MSGELNAGFCAAIGETPLSETRSLLAHGSLWAGCALQAPPSVMFTWVLPAERKTQRCLFDPGC